MMFRVHLDSPNLGEIDKEYLAKAIDVGYVSTAGSFIREFEDKFAKYIGTGRAISVQSGTAALHIALYELGIGKGDEVIIPALTFIATVNPILYVGAKPVIVDVDSGTWNIDPKEIEKAITAKTKAIIPVHLYGNVCDMDSIVKIAKEHSLYVIEDATESLGATYKGKQTGTVGSMGCFSFNGNKLITTGGGGMVVTDDKERAGHIEFLVDQARVDSKSHYHSEMGFNYRMTNIEAALGLAQFKRIDEFLGKKRRFRQIYQEALGDLSCVRFQKQHDGTEGNWWLTCIEVEKDMDVDDLIKKLMEEGIRTRRVFVPVSKMPYLREYSRPYPNAHGIHERGLCLPSSTLNEEETIERVADIIRMVLGEGIWR